jgi:hypothetical protein
MTIDFHDIAIQDVSVTGDGLSVDLMDGRSITVPLAWYPRLYDGTVQERNNWRLIGRGAGIHWPELDEDISVEAIILGRPSNESQKSLQRWLASRQSRRS